MSISVLFASLIADIVLVLTLESTVIDPIAVVEFQFFRFFAILIFGDEHLEELISSPRRD